MTPTRKTSPPPSAKQSRSHLHYLSLAIAAIALTVLVLFFFPWIDDPASEGERVLTGLEIAVQSTILTAEDFPSGVLFIVPLLAAGFLWEYYRKVKSPYRPRRRRSFAGMMIIGIGAVVLWGRAFAQAASDCLQDGSCVPLTPEQASYTPQDVILNLYTTNLWLYVGLSLLLLVLPFWDMRPPEPRQEEF